MRNELLQTILSRGFQNNGFATFASLKGRYEMNLASFKRNTSDELSGLYNREMESADDFRMKKIIEAAYENPSFINFPYTRDELWTNGVAFLNSLKQVEDNSSLSIRRTAEEQLSDISDAMFRSVVLALVLVFLIIFLLYTIIRSMVNSVLQIKDAADRISMGDLNLTVPINSRDEIGSLATSFNRLIKVSREYAENAEIIGGGDYSPTINVRSKIDTLGISLQNMKNNLQKLSKENENRTWLLTGNSELNDKVRGEKEVHELAQQVISQLSTYLDARIGAIYLAENGRLTLAGSYAFHHRKENANHIELGQGLVGQAALEKKPIIFSEIPEDYVRINSGLGNSAPKNIIIFPFEHEGQLKGVIEIGSAREFTELELEFLKLVAENIGIAFHSSQSRTQLKELLEETQRQTEELETQQEELRQINEELQEKTDLLERSEAELKAQQEELQQTNEELEEKANLLEQQKEALEVAKMEVESKARELETTSRYKSEFLANMSHELRTPLNSILILAQLLAENKSKALAEKEVAFAENIYSSGTDLLNLINEILDLSKVESGKIELDISAVRLPEVSENLRSLFRELARTKNTSFEINIGKDIADYPITTDQQRLEQILRNLLSNAFKFTERGGEVSMEVRKIFTSQVYLNSNLRKLDSVIAFKVKDTGIGIPMEKQGLIFEAFQQADGSTKRKYGGTGLGLSISRELARALGGEIQLESEEAKGSTFTLYLPPSFDETIAEPLEKEVLVRAVPGKTVARLPIANISGSEDADDDRHNIHEHDKIILIIEDDLQFSEILLNFVREKHYKGIIAHQGNTGLSLARYYRPDAIILDMKLPVMDGTAVLKHLKNDPELRHIPVQVISGYDHRKEGYELGAFDVVKKPVNQGDLDSAFGRIEEFINKKLKKLLVVEDNKQQNMAIRELIGNGDVKSFSAYTGEEAHQMLLNDKFDCIIIDLGLPDMGGIDLLEKLKAHETLKKIPVIVYTGQDLSKQQALQLNRLANTVVLKTADSHERLLDETTLFLHRIEAKLPPEKQAILRKLHRTDEVLMDKKILIVDDDMRNIYSLTNALEEEGVRCITAENGKAALKTLKAHPDIDIILMDVMMPEMDGYEATQEIRKIEKFGKLPIIALTAKAMKGDRERCLEAGMSDYIAKPVNIEKLLSLMRVWLYR
jgi:CheY-like chemotaxis protein/signal transduction histidine kinase